MAWSVTDNSGWTISTTTTTNDTATVQTQGGITAVRGTTSHNDNQKYYFDITWNETDTGGQHPYFGIADDSQSLTDNIGGEQSNDAIVFLAQVGAGSSPQIFDNSFTLLVGWTDSDHTSGTVAFIINPSTKVLYSRYTIDNGSNWSTWNNDGSANPATDTGGLTASIASTTMFPYTASFNTTANNFFRVLNTGASAFVGSINPATFGAVAWDGGAPAGGASFIPPGPLTIAVGGAELLRRNPILRRRSFFFLPRGGWRP